jgi:hypothetical protein
MMTDTIPRQAVIDAVRSVPPGTTCRGDAIIAAINAIPAVDEWQPIETYKSEKALFYCPAIIGALHSSNNKPEYYTFDRPLHRPPTHWRPLPKPPLVAALGE